MPGTPARCSAPTARTLSYRAMKRPGFEADRLAVMAMDLARGTVREIAPRWDRSADNLALVAGRPHALRHRQRPRPARRCSRSTIASGKVREGRRRDGHVGGVSPGTAMRIVIAHDDLDSPAQLYRVRAARRYAAALTAFNADKLAGVALRRGRAVHLRRRRRRDRARLAGQAGRTSTRRRSTRSPSSSTAARRAASATTVSYRWNPQTYAGQGFAAVMVDFHGSTGYGQAFTDAISRRLGRQAAGGPAASGSTRRWRSTRSSTATSVCALGGSYGGYMVNWIAGQMARALPLPRQPRRRVRHPRDGLHRPRSCGSPSGNTAARLRTNPEDYAKFNPADHVAKWKTPMLVIHGELDYRVPYTQGIAAFTAAAACAASPAATCTSPTRTTGSSSRPTRSSGTTRSMPG